MVSEKYNKEDKVYMRKHADEKIKMLSAGIVKRTSKSIPVKTKPQVKQKIGHSQTLFENAKK